ncbi:MAG: hypothetical protein JRJ19_06940 [Deltaproteobacteria bacterium]|nr:hypothetical protein [Deltaproteobacteria bacterium]MBW1871782.1 hypothetical protein [Deltaproteobacteria bacterium]
MASGTRQTTTTKKEALEKVKADLDRLSSLQANVLRMRYGINERPSASVGKPARGCKAQTRKKAKAIEEDVLERVRGKEPEDTPNNTKDKIVRSIKKKS